MLEIVRLMQLMCCILVIGFRVALLIRPDLGGLEVIANKLEVIAIGLGEYARGT